MPRLRYKRGSVAVIGTGLIGASVGLAARVQGITVTGWDVNVVALRGARRRSAISRVAASLRDAVASSDIVVLAAPLDSVLAHLRQVFEYARKGALVIDVASVKEPVSKLATTLLAKRRDVRFIAGHPLAGSEHSGPAAAEAKLFAGRTFALHAPPQALPTQAYSAAARFVRKLGAVPIRISPRDHDRAMSALSALPQLASIAVALASSDGRGRIDRRLAGPGYRDTTRLAESGFAMWKPVLSANRGNILRSVRALQKRVSVIQAALQRSDWRALGRLFSAAARARRRVNPR